MMSVESEATRAPVPAPDGIDGQERGGDQSFPPEGAVTLGRDWCDRWLPMLDQVELQLYLALSAQPRGKTSCQEANSTAAAWLADRGEMAGGRIEEALESLQERGLVEIVTIRETRHVNLLHRDRAAVHRAEAMRSRLADALEFQESVSSELGEVAARDETPELRDEVFARHPDLRAEYDLQESAADVDAPRLRLWMELSRHLMRVFEERFGLVRDEHRELFRDTVKRELSERMEKVEAITSELLARRTTLFPESGEGWIVMPRMAEFASSTLVQGLAKRYGQGPEMLFVSLIEALEQEGLVVVSCHDGGAMESLILPVTTGLAADQEAVLLGGRLSVGGDPERYERWLGLRSRYASHLVDRAVAVLVEFSKSGRVRDIDAMLQHINDRVNDALELLDQPSSEGVEDDAISSETELPPAFELCQVVTVYDRCKSG